ADACWRSRSTRRPDQSPFDLAALPPGMDQGGGHHSAAIETGTMSKPAAPLPPLTTPPDAWRIGGSLLAMVLAVATVLLVDAKTEFEVVEKSLLWAGNKLELDDVFYATESLGEYPALIVIFWAIIALAPRR